MVTNVLLYLWCFTEHLLARTHMVIMSSLAARLYWVEGVMICSGSTLIEMLLKRNDFVARDFVAK